MKNKLFLKNAATLTLTSFIIRGIGILFRIYMAAQLGAEGMGLYQLVFSIYTLAAAAGSGLPAAVTAKISSIQNDRSRLRPLLFAMLAAAGVLSLSGVTFFFGADAIAGLLIADARTALSLKILCFSLPFMGMSACIRGYFIAEHNTIIPSAAQIFEQLVRIGVIVGLLTLFGSADLETACAAVLFGDSVAEFCSFLFFLISMSVSIRKKPAGGRLSSYRREMVAASAPITGSRYLSTLLHSAENMIIPACLAAGIASPEAAVSEFGMLKGMAMPLLFFPASFLGALSTLLLPEISEAAASGNRQKVKSAAAGAIGITLTASIPIMAIFWSFGGEIALLVYGSAGVGKIMVALAPIVPFMYLESVCDGILKGLTQQKHSLLYNVIDSSARIAAIFLFVPKYGMTGFLWIMIFSNIFTSSMNIRRLLKVAGLRLPLWRFVFLPLMLAGAGVGLSRLLCRPLPAGWLSLGGRIFVTAGVYLGLTLLLCRKRGGPSILWKM